MTSNCDKDFRSKMALEIKVAFLEAVVSLKKEPPPYSDDHGLRKEDFEELACEDEDYRSADHQIEQQGKEFQPRRNGVGYPVGPMHLHLSQAIADLIMDRKRPGKNFIKYDLLDEGDNPERRAELFNSLSDFVAEKDSLWSLWNSEEKVYFMKEVILKLGKRGLLDLLGLRHTVGTHCVFPPPRSVLSSAFESTNNDRSNLTVGARALAKHFHRDSSASFWGTSSGTEADKNRHAREIVTKILDGATWINIHELPGQLPIIEMRIHEGYGARWSMDGTVFRGFLEPMMQEGWVNKYRH